MLMTPDKGEGEFFWADRAATFYIATRSNLRKVTASAIQDTYPIRDRRLIGYIVMTNNGTNDVPNMSPKSTRNIQLHVTKGVTREA